LRGLGEIRGLPANLPRSLTAKRHDPPIRSRLASPGDAMSGLFPGQSPHEEKPPVSPADRLTRSTTRLILIAIVAGGLLTVALNLQRPDLPDSDDPLNLPDEVAPVDHFLSESFPVAREIVKGDEAAARQAVVRIGRKRMTAAAEKVVALRTRKGPVARAESPFEGSLELASDPGGKWTIRQIQDLRRIIIGVATAGPEPTVVFWGGYDETGPGEWTAWTMLLPLPEK
jgi:hypothetical protein